MRTNEEIFQEAWLAANARGEQGARVKAGLAALESAGRLATVPDAAEVAMTENSKQHHEVVEETLHNDDSISILCTCGARVYLEKMWSYDRPFTELFKLSEQHRKQAPDNESLPNHCQECGAWGTSPVHLRGCASNKEEDKS